MQKVIEEISVEKENIEATLKVLYEAFNRPERTVVELSAIGAKLPIYGRALNSYNFYPLRL